MISSERDLQLPTKDSFSRPWTYRPSLCETFVLYEEREIVERPDED